MRRVLLGLLAGCGDGTTPPCDAGFVKVDGRWCVYEEAPLVIRAGGDDDPEPEPEPEPVEEDDPVDPSEYIKEAEPVEPLLSLAQIEAGIGAAIDTVQSIDPAPLHAVYRQVRADGDLSCPSYDEEYTLDYPDRLYWRDACTVGAGASFSGYVYSYDFGSYIDSSETYEYGGYAYYNGSAKVVDSQGHTFIGSGYSSYYERTHLSNNDVTFYSSLSGNFRTDNPDYAGTWLERDLNISLHLSGTLYEEGYTAIAYDVSMSGLEGAINAIRLDDVYLYAEDLGSMCELEPAGLIGLRDEAGSWYEVEFDGPKYWGAGAFPPDCDGCGRVYFRGQLLGEVCPDFSRLQTFEHRPWQ
jgi:hypothetical protein